SFLAQAVSALFAVAFWWGVTAWDDEPSLTAAAVVSGTAVGVFLTWPVWIGPPLLTFLGLVLTRHEWPWRSRVKTLVVSLAPLAIVAIVHAAGSGRWAQLVRSSGAALAPSTSVLGWLFPVLALLGVPVAFRNRRARTTLLMLAAIAVQGLVLYVMARSIGAETPYMALKMMYLAIYPLAVLSSLGLFAILRSLSASALEPSHARFGETSAERPFGRVGGPALPAVICAAIAVFTIRPMLAAQRPTPVVSRDFYDAGQWVRANVGTTCVDYL